jgi:hypothetical protein
MSQKVIKLLKHSKLLKTKIMKQIFTLIAALTMTASLWAQSPDKMSYQAVVRNTNDALVTATAVGMQISILQGSATGTAVYTETQTPNTNANGLVSLEIGTGTTIDDFSTIDWSTGPYFIKTETDPTGGTTYTITGTSQLLSVPYALHAKTAENVTGALNETDPIFEASVANGITAVDTANWNNHTDSTAIADMGYRTGKKYAIGDFAKGGIVFWVDETGEHGLVCAKSDQSTGIRWTAGTNGNFQTYSDGIYSGKENTSIIVASTLAIGNDGAPYAALICHQLQITEDGINYGDWYLPSRTELYEMHLNFATIDATALLNGGSVFGSGKYWCSNMLVGNFSPDVMISISSGLFHTGGPTNDGTNNQYSVRAIRAF